MTAALVKKGTPAPRRRAGLARILLPAALAVAAVYFLFPVYWLTIAATKSTGSLFGSSGFVLSDPQLLQNLLDVVRFKGGVFLGWGLNSLLYSGVGALAATLLSMSAGYALAKFAFRGREVWFNLVLAGVMIPGTALALPLFLLMSRLGLVNTVWAVLIPSMISPFGVYLGRIYATAAVPDSLLEAARLDGAGEGRIFLTLVLRLMAPAAVTVFLFQFIGVWNNYFLPLVMLSNQELYPITLGLVSWQSVADRHPELYQLAVGGSFLSVIPIMIAIVSLQRFWRAGLTEGSVKG
ncbi:multiple sugar transport system permease protein [Rathayibacter sp. PhB93]|uniref:carbohydrate ABC transporter permease n=1 Tax=unclassified Rathayibacter TaxID=2609250 RepID=UPI000F47BE10|nr:MULTISPECIES: carbohydrate ABC transporter permease [unclassified Rathayibacter]ROQ04561.1 multiple sugar transport system permease protein [Rathayibacter sp. PhB93]TDQ13399.1 multiple sugar transport system permease protein [Rathayibacter sp. PhB1]